MQTPIDPFQPQDPFRAFGKTDPTIVENEKRSQKIFSIVLTLLILGGIALSAWFLLGPEWEHNRILKEGLPAKGVIVDIVDTGNRFNDQPQTKITVEVTLPDGEKYETETLMIISPVYLSDFRRGTSVDLKYDPKDRKKIAIE